MSVTITELRVGSCSHPQCMALKGAPWAPRDFPSRAYLLESDRDGIWLWDTGYSPRFFAASKGVYRLYGLTTPVTLPRKERLAQQLKDLKVPLEHLSGVLLSHFHADHVAGLAELPKVPVWASRDAWASFHEVKGFSALLRGQIPALVPKRAIRRARAVEGLEEIVLPEQLRPFEKAWKLTPDLLVVSLPGHARGHLGLFVNERTSQGPRWTLLASDAAWSQEAFSSPKGLRGPSELSFLIQHDRQAYYDTLARLRTLHQRGVPIRLSHDPWPHALSEDETC